MGIDIYMRWQNQTEAEKTAQYTGFDATAGTVGYLREAYHGGPYATRILMPEAFEDEATENDGAPIPAETLRERLPATLEAVAERERVVYENEVPSPEILRSFEAFVELAERLEAEGKKPRIYASY